MGVYFADTGKAPKRDRTEWHMKEFSSDPDRRNNRPKSIGSQSWEVALRPGAAGNTSNPVSGKYSFTFVLFYGP